MKKFDIINEINESIKIIQETSFRIRLYALNSQIAILSISFGIEKNSGFSAISSELINISKDFEHKAEDLFHILYESIQLITKERKLLRNRIFHEKILNSNKSNANNIKFNSDEISNRIFIKSNNELNKITSKFTNNNIKLKKIVIEAGKLCKYSKPIIFSVKIESAYLGKHLKVFTQLADELTESITKIESELKEIQIKNILLQNLEGNL